MNLYSINQIIDEHVDRLLGTEIHALLVGDKAQEISVNADGRIFVDDGTGPMFEVQGHVEPLAVESVIKMLAAVNGLSLDPAAPFLDTVVLNCGARFNGALPPVAIGSQLSIRTHARIQRPLTAFMTEAQAEQVRGYIRDRKNIVVGGATNSGKTTLINAMLREVSPTDRLAIIEDTVELQVPDGNVIRRQTSPGADLRHHIRQILRIRPDRIIIGEVRGPEAFDMIDATRTGHSGCMSSVHANSAFQAISRLAGLAGCSPEIVREGINTLLFVERDRESGRRRLSEVELLN